MQFTSFDAILVLAVLVGLAGFAIGGAIMISKFCFKAGSYVINEIDALLMNDEAAGRTARKPSGHTRVPSTDLEPTIVTTESWSTVESHVDQSYAIYDIPTYQRNGVVLAF